MITCPFEGGSKAGYVLSSSTRSLSRTGLYCWFNVHFIFPRAAGGDSQEAS